MKKVKIIVDHYSDNLERAVNAFIQNHENNIIDIKYQHTTSDTRQLFSAMIIYLK